MCVTSPALAQSPVPARSVWLESLDSVPRVRADVAPPPDEHRSGPVRPFLGVVLDVGFLHLRPRVTAGWGLPFRTWLGLEVSPLVDTQQVGAYGGVRLRHPFVDLRVGARRERSFGRPFLSPRRAYDRQELREDEGPSARLSSVEAELSLSLPAGPHRLLAEVAVHGVLGVPEGRFVLEEHLGVVVDPPWLWRTRVGVELRIGRARRWRWAVVSELLGVPARALVVVRAGLQLRVTVSPRLEIRGAWVPAIISRDRLGLLGGDFASLGLRWFYATGSTAAREESPATPGLPARAIAR